MKIKSKGFKKKEKKLNGRIKSRMSNDYFILRVQSQDCCSTAIPKLTMDKNTRRHSLHFFDKQCRIYPNRRLDPRG